MIADKCIYKFPSSFAQQQLLLADGLCTDMSIYNINNCTRFIGLLNRHAIERSIYEICRRHEILRTTFDQFGEELFQIVGSGKSELLKIVNLRELSSKKQNALVQSLAQHEACQTFDTQKGPLMRIILLILNEQEHVLISTYHHAIFDEWSLAIFYKELSTLYASFSRGRLSHLPELTIQYADYTVHQKDYLQTPSSREDLQYWTVKLAGADVSLNLPTDRPYPPKLTYLGNTQSFEIDGDLYGRLVKIAQGNDCTQFMLFLAAYMVLLNKYSQQKDILVGTPITVRDSSDTQNLIGLFLNTIVLRAEISTEQTFKDILTQIKNTILEAHCHRYMPFAQVAQSVQTRSSKSRHRLFQVMFVFNHIIDGIHWDGLETQWVHVPNQTAKFDLTLYLTQTQRGLRGSIEYSIDLFDALTIQRMVSHLNTLLASISENPELPIADLSILTKAERHQLLFEWNQIKAPVRKLHKHSKQDVTEKAGLVWM